MSSSTIISNLDSEKIQEPKKFVLITQEKELEEYFESILKTKKYTCRLFSTIEECQNWILGQTIDGVFVDIKKVIESDEEEKAYIENLSEIITLAKIRWDKDKKIISGSLPSGSFKGDEFFKNFFASLPEAPVIVRRYMRRKCILNIKIFIPSSKKEFLSNAIDISQGGAFILAYDVVEKNESLVLTFCDWQASGDIPAKVRWGLPWGKSQIHLPGVGVEFMTQTLAPDRKKILHDYIELVG